MAYHWRLHKCLAIGEIMEKASSTIFYLVAIIVIGLVIFAIWMILSGGFKISIAQAIARMLGIIQTAS